MKAIPVLIVGAGPAGITAALQLKRGGIEPVIVEKGRVGGALLNAGWVENYPPFSPGISGQELAGLFADHLKCAGIEIHPAAITNLQWEKGEFLARSAEGELHAQIVLLASGTIPCRLDIQGERELSGAGVYHELKDVPEGAALAACVIGGGDVACDYALSLAKRKIHVKLAMRSPQPRCLKLLETRLRSEPLIEMLNHVEPQAIEKEGSSIRVYFRGQDAPSNTCDFVLVAIGRKPQVEFLSPLLQTKRYPDLPLFWAGDVVNGSLRQVGIAVGDGLRCAMEITRHFARQS